MPFISSSVISPYNSIRGGVYNFEQGYDFEDAINFNGDNQYATMANFSQSNSWTISMWVKPTSTTSRMLGSQSNGGILIGLSSLTDFRVNIGNNSVFAINAILNQWNHILVVKDTSTSNAGNVYVNGVASISNPLNISNNISGINQIIKQGTIISEGISDDLLFWNNKVGTLQNAIDLYNGGAGVDPTTVIPNPNRWYKFNGNPDDSGSDAQNLTLFNSPTYVPH